jgi:GTP-binding protein
MVADIGLVGLPNAGKSTLLSKLTAARPKIADYPFTTLTPNLGVVDADRRIVLADVPGLIEGAHQGRGLGLGFLRHVSRCRALVVVVDLSSEDPVEDLRTVRAELDSYDVALGGRALLVAASKIDLLEDSSDVLARLSAEAETVAVSGLTGEGVGTLQARLDALAQEATEEEEREPYVVLRPARERFVVTRHGGGFHVSGRDVERWVEATDLDDPAAVATLQRRLTREGVERKLSALGARRGDEVVIAGKAFEFLPEEDGWTGDRS